MCRNGPPPTVVVVSCSFPRNILKHQSTEFSNLIFPHLASKLRIKQLHWTCEFGSIKVAQQRCWCSTRLKLLQNCCHYSHVVVSLDLDSLKIQPDHLQAGWSLTDIMGWHKHCRNLTCQNFKHLGWSHQSRIKIRGWGLRLKVINTGYVWNGSYQKSTNESMVWKFWIRFQYTSHVNMLVHSYFAILLPTELRLLRNRFKPQTKQKNCNHPSQSYNIESSRSILVGIHLALRPAWDSHTSAPCLEITSISLSLRPLQSLKSHYGNACLNHVFLLGLLHGPLPVWWLTPMMLTKGRKFTPSSSKWRKA